ncbi:hypothetical protein TWF481_011041 [Arthrobotrys musiformis]|uniref:Uncharacterized protein n=1 Tax=Arthrobotrys musiformis TaxID=47236 RepID=A0AAV9VXB0_9PEZI
MGIKDLWAAFTIKAPQVPEYLELAEAASEKHPKKKMVVKAIRIELDTMSQEYKDRVSKAKKSKGD